MLCASCIPSLLHCTACHIFQSVSQCFPIALHLLLLFFYSSKMLFSFVALCSPAVRCFLASLLRVLISPLIAAMRSAPLFRQVLPADNIFATVIYVLAIIFSTKGLFIFQLQYALLNKICYNIGNNKSNGEIIVREFIHYIYLVLKLIVIVISLYIFVALAFVIVGGILMDLFLK